jgi:hypothetical protein
MATVEESVQGAGAGTPPVVPFATRGSAAAPERKGVFEPRSVRFLSFIVIALGLFVTAVFCILAIWDYATRDTAWRAVATLGVVAGTMLVFTFINEMFGSRMER